MVRVFVRRPQVMGVQECGIEVIKSVPRAAARVVSLPRPRRAGEGKVKKCFATRPGPSSLPLPSPSSPLLKMCECANVLLSPVLAPCPPGSIT